MLLAYELNSYDLLHALPLALTVCLAWNVVTVSIRVVVSIDTVLSMYVVVSTNHRMLHQLDQQRIPIWTREMANVRTISPLDLKMSSLTRRGLFVVPG